ncbi:MAG TPA: hypothetical protein PLY08_00920 [Bacillota bacterium]|nr:hypothetical protein [Bacillota bacterium]
MNDVIRTTPKEGLVLDVAKKFIPVPAGTPGIRFRSMKGGQALDEIPAEAKLLVLAPDYTDVQRKIAVFQRETGWDVGHRARGKSLEIFARSGMPGKERNAVSILMDLAGRLPFAGDDIREFFDFYNRHIGFSTDGDALGIGTFAPSREVPFVQAGAIEMSPETAGLTLYIAGPLPCREEEIFEAMMPVLNRYDMGLVKRPRQDEEGSGAARRA